MRRRLGWLFFVGLLSIFWLGVSAGGLILAGQVYARWYDNQIYPGVHVYGVDLGGLTVEEAVPALQGGLPDPAAFPLTLHAGEDTWVHSWATLGLEIDPWATARMAYRVGREGAPGQRRLVQLQALLAGWQASPVIVLPDPAQASRALASLASDVVIPPADATLVIQPEGLLTVPAQPGRELDVPATVALLPHAIRAGPRGLNLELLTRQTAPAIQDVGPVRIQVEALLAAPFVIEAADRLTEFSAAWSVPPAVVATWLLVHPVQAEGGTQLVLSTQEEAIRSYVEGLESHLGDQLTLDVWATVAEVTAAIENGGHSAVAVLGHPEQVYTVQPGDTLVSVAHAHGFPVWQVIQANPNVDPGGLRPGQEIIIPSIDVLFPLPLIDDRRVLIDLSDQRLYAYEGDELIYDFPCSTGIPSSPTIAGSFQILSKEEEAYASSWDLWMPHFMGIYRSGPDFTNGIHALPTLSSGVRLWEGYLGNPISYGCIVLGLEEAAMLYDWTPLGILVVIRD